MERKENTMTTHEELLEQFEIYKKEDEKFTQKKIKASATRERKALSEIMRLAKLRRAEILEEKGNDEE